MKVKVLMIRKKGVKWLVIRISELKGLILISVWIKVDEKMVVLILMVDIISSGLIMIIFR